MNSESKQVKRLHTRDRRRGYRSPTEADVKCPFFNDKFFRTGRAFPADDMIAVCHDNDKTAVCDYKNMIVDPKLCLCHRYLKKDVTPMTPSTGFKFDEADQQVDVVYKFIRKFENYFADVTADVVFKHKGTVSMDVKNWDDFPSYGANVWNKLEHGYVVSNANTSASRLIYEGRNYELLTDYEFSVKGYVDARQNDGDMVGVVFRHTSKGYYLLDWDGGDNGHGLTLTRVSSSGATTVLRSSGTTWKHGVHYQYFVSLEGPLISIRVINITNNTTVAEFALTDSVLPNGSFGMYASSQQDAYFYDILGKGGQVYTHATVPELKQRLSLKWDGISVLPQPIGSYFDDVVQKLLAENDEFELDYITYTIETHNLMEDLYFGTPGVKTTEDPTAKIMITDYDYEKIQEIQFQFIIDKNDMVIKTRDDVFLKNALLISYHITATEQKYQDSLSLAIDDNKLLRVPNVLDPIYKEDVNREIPIGGTIHFIYQPYNMEIAYFTGPSIDTHDKVYKVRANELGWHKDIKRRSED